MFKCLFSLYFIVRLLISNCLHMSCICNCLFLISLTRNPTDCNHFSCSWNKHNEGSKTNHVFFFWFTSIYSFTNLIRACWIYPKTMYWISNIIESFRKVKHFTECSGHIVESRKRIQSKVPVNICHKSNVGSISVNLGQVK